MLQLKAGWDNLQYPVLPSLITIDSAWYFELGNSSEGLNTSFREFEGGLVHLPHRIAYPDHPFWYKRKIKLDQPGYLHVRADDGAQVYSGEKRLEMVSGNFFFLNMTDTAEITIRVLNNAMRGGLQRVTFLSIDQYKNFQRTVQDYHIKKQLIKKVLLKTNVTKPLLSLAEQILGSGDSVHVNQLKHALEDYPYLIGPYLMKDGDSVRVMAIGEDSRMISLAWGHQPDNLLYHLSTMGPVANFKLGELDRGTNYYYRIKSAGTTTDVVRIARENYGSFAFNVWADSQSGWDAFRQSMKMTGESNDAFGIGVGDLVSNGSDSTQWLYFFSMLSSSAGQIPYYLIAGNHDYDGFYDDLIPRHYYRYTANKTSYQSWEYDNAAFIALDPNEGFPIGIVSGSKQYEWFHEQLQSEMWNQATWRFIVLHQPPFSQGWEGYHGDQVIRDLLEPVLEKAKVDFVVSGHTHDYERLSKTYGVQRVTFLVVGGAGGALEGGGLSDVPKMDTVIKEHHIGRFFVDGSRITFKALGHDGRALDSIVREKNKFEKRF